MDFENIAIPAHDGEELRGDLHVSRADPETIVVLSHSMMTDRRTLDRPKNEGLLSKLRERGVGVLCVDLRGHGESGPPADRRGSWTYDDLVADVGSVTRYVADRFPRARRIAVGHSLFGHAALAYQATKVAPEEAESNGFHGFVLIGASVWAPQFEPSRLKWMVKSIIARTSYYLLPARGVFPVRRLRIGSADESLAFIHQMTGWVVKGDWTDLNGRSYRTALKNVTVPVLSIAGEGDLILSTPGNQARFVSLTSGAVQHEVVGKSTGYAFNPGHMDLVLDRRLEGLWKRISVFVAEGR